MPDGFSAGDTAFVLISAALVMVMTPGLAFFYGGMVRAKSTLNMLAMSFLSLGIVTVLWVLYGYSLSFGPDSFAGLIGNLDFLGMRGIGLNDLNGTIPVTAFAMFQLMFAVITPALISGAIADRAKFAAWGLFVALWVSIVYFPVAHWVFFTDNGNGGWLGDRNGVIDFAGGTAVHINAGVAGLALCLVLGKRVGFKKDPMRPHSLPLVMLGSGLLWFGWFGFNAGSALAANGVAAMAFVNTQVATGAALIGWLAYEKLKHGSFTTLGAASGAVAGLVAITPACGSVSPLGAVAIGLIAGVVCAAAVSLKYRWGFDDSLDVVGVHAVGGAIGSLLIGLFATGGVGQAAKGLFYGGGLEQLGKQAMGVAVVAAYSFAVSWLLAKAIDRTVGFRVAEEVEVAGIDQAEHAESAYDFSAVGAGLARAVTGLTGAAAERTAVKPAEKTEVDAR
ncbi:ammonium transporter [Streptomyces rubellomurinus]|uniref:Ammonium transporter n=2 Tax=Streptomyces TaxID=1883 RepID=A0A0F2T9L2_STRR3|nr:ammonium transporter [Streptomyces rubellomurinus]KJS57086.1 ammonia channel protein [Streptomyces rubellomurinus subsp. indigoferus]KJS59908.1 ammonia channel protein [Streptomyces rubellomurinus]